MLQVCATDANVTGNTAFNNQTSSFSFSASSTFFSPVNPAQFINASNSTPLLRYSSINSVNILLSL